MRAVSVSLLEQSSALGGISHAHRPPSRAPQSFSPTPLTGVAFLVLQHGADQAGIKLRELSAEICQRRGCTGFRRDESGV